MSELDYTKRKLSTLKTDARILASELANVREMEAQKSKELENNIHDQNEVWFELIRQSLKEHDLIYCRRCAALQPVKDSRFLAITETSQESSRHFFKTTYNIYRFCQRCTQEAIQQTPKYGKYDKDAGGQYYFSAGLVHKSDDDRWFRDDNGGVLLENPEQWYFGDDLFYKCGRCHYHLGGEANHEITQAVDLIVKKFSLPRPLETESEPVSTYELTLKETETAAA